MRPTTWTGIVIDQGEEIPADVKGVTDSSGYPWRCVVFAPVPLWRCTTDPATTVTGPELCAQFGPVTVTDVAPDPGFAAADMTEAARLMREIASSVPPGPWITWFDDEDQTWSLRLATGTRERILKAHQGRGVGYFATLPPAVVLAMADVLEACAHRMSMVGDGWAPADHGVFDLATAFLTAVCYPTGKRQV